MHARIIAVVVALAISVSAGTANAGPLRETAVRAGREAVAKGVLPQQSPQRVRSRARMAIGGLLIIAGTFTPFNWSTRCPAGEENSYLGFDCYADAEKALHAEYASHGGLVAGLSMAVFGTLLATVWSDVPAQQSVDLTIAPDRVQPGRQDVRLVDRRCTPLRG